MALSPMMLGAVAIVAVLLAVVVYFMFMTATLPEGYVNGMVIGGDVPGASNGPFLIQGGKKRMYDMNVWMAIQPRNWVLASPDVLAAIPSGAPILSVDMSKAADAAVAGETFAARRR